MADRTVDVPLELMLRFDAFTRIVDLNMSNLITSLIEEWTPESFDLHQVSLSEPADGRIEFSLSESAEADLARIVASQRISAADVVKRLIAHEVEAHAQVIDDTKLGPREDATSDTPAVDRIVLQVGLGSYSPEDEVAEHLAGLIHAMSLWQIANGGNPLEVEKMLPLVAVGEGVPHG